MIARVRALACVALLLLPVVGGAADADFAAAVRAAAARHPAPDARLAVGDAFLRFETSTLHAEIAATDPAAYSDIETRWLALAGMMRVGAPAAEVRARAEELAALLERAGAGARAPVSTASLFVDSLLIIVREGFEAILILGALIAYLTKVGAADRRVLIWSGAGAAVAASVALAAVARWLIPMSGAFREALEGITMLLATVVLFAASYWLISKAEARHWQAFVRARLEGALGSGRGTALVLVSFLVVFREGFETVLFYQALALRADDVRAGLSAVASGFAVGVAVLAVVWVALVRWGLRIPMRPFFAITGALLYLLAFKFAGAGVRELQEAGWVSVTPAALPDLAALGDWLGVYPFAEPLLAQGLLLAALAGGMVWVGLVRRAPSLDGREAARP